MASPIRTFSLLTPLCALILAHAAPAHAARESRSMKIDHRVRTIMYQPDEVFRFVGHYGFQSAIQFSEGERIQTISMGDSTSWMINPVGSMMFLKPLDRDATTNMTLITNERMYLFELSAREAGSIDDPQMTFIMRFIYPGQDGTMEGNGVVRHYLDSVPIPDLVNEPDKYNFRYTISGPEEVAPIRIFDDGQFTYFEFRDKNADVPAFFTVNRDNEEALINYRTRGNYIVVERVSQRMTLRHGKQVICVFNEAWNPAKLPPAPTDQRT